MASVTSSSATAPPPAELTRLKRLEFVPANVAFGVAAASHLYSRARSFVPATLSPTLEKVEQGVATLAAPLAVKAQDMGAQVLVAADEKVDQLLASSSKGVAERWVACASCTSSQLAEWAKDKVSVSTAGQAALAALHSVMNRAKQVADADVAAKLVTDAWATFAAVPIVAKTLETADPATQAALRHFYQLHDQVVGWAVYKRVVDTGASTLLWATGTSTYKLGAMYVYPLLQPVADPALDKLASSKVVQEALTYWKPTTTAA